VTELGGGGGRGGGGGGGGGGVGGAPPPPPPSFLAMTSSMVTVTTTTASTAQLVDGATFVLVHSDGVRGGLLQHGVHSGLLVSSSSSTAYAVVCWSAVCQRLGHKFLCSCVTVDGIGQLPRTPKWWPRRDSRRRRQG
jgi:hypothetical protein